MSNDNMRAAVRRLLKRWGAATTDALNERRVTKLDP